MHILVVDDLDDNRNLLVQLIEDDYRVSEARDGAAALAMIDTDPPDLVLLDLAMPVMDGFQVLDQLEHYHEGFLPVIVVTATHESTHRVRALEAGAHEFLTKPIVAEELHARLRTMLEIKATRDVLERRNVEIAALLEARTAELERERRDRAEIARLEAVDNTKDRLLAVVGHEFRTPLNIITGFAALLEDDLAQDTSPTRRNYLDQIGEGARRLISLVENLLELASLASGRLALRRSEEDFAALVAMALDCTAAAAEERGHEILIDMQVQQVVSVDPERMVRVLIELLTNAIKFTPADGRIRVRARADGGELLVEIEDDGMGIDELDLPRLFTSFDQLDMSTTRTQSGTGLGLALVKAIVEAHGGGIGVASQPDRGSRFWFTLPVDETAG